MFYWDTIFKVVVLQVFWNYTLLGEGHVCSIEHLGKSEDSVCEFTLGFHHGCFGAQTQVVRNDRKHFYPLSLHTGPNFSVPVTLTYFQTVLAIVCKQVWLCFWEASLKVSEADDLPALSWTTRRGYLKETLCSKVVKPQVMWSLKSLSSWKRKTKVPRFGLSSMVGFSIPIPPSLVPCGYPTQSWLMLGMKLRLPRIHQQSLGKWPQPFSLCQMSHCYQLGQGEPLLHNPVGS